MGDMKVGISGIVIAGGAAARMGGAKPFMPFRGGWLIDAVIARAEPQVESLMVNIRPEHEAQCRARYGEKFRLLRDALGSEAGPLGGVIAGLEALPSTGGAWLATFPCDTPFLPIDIVAMLRAGATKGCPAVAAAGGATQSLCALWPPDCLDALREGVVSGALRSVWRALDLLGASHIEIDAAPHAFFNVNTPEDLTEAERLAIG